MRRRGCLQPRHVLLCGFNIKLKAMKKVETNNAPKAVGPYSQAVIAGDFVFCSGQIAISPETGDLVGGGIVEQTNQVLNNLEAVLKEAGVDLSKVVKTEVYLKNMGDYVAMNEVYAQKFSSVPQPARVTVEVAKLPKSEAVLVEISCIACLK